MPALERIARATQAPPDLIRAASQCAGALLRTGCREARGRSGAARVRFGAPRARRRPRGCSGRAADRAARVLKRASPRRRLVPHRSGPVSPPAAQPRSTPPVDGAPRPEAAGAPGAGASGVGRGGAPTAERLLPAVPVVGEVAVHDTADVEAGVAHGPAGPGLGERRLQAGHDALADRELLLDVEAGGRPEVVEGVEPAAELTAMTSAVLRPRMEPGREEGLEAVPVAAAPGAEDLTDQRGADRVLLGRARQLPRRAATRHRSSARCRRIGRG